jgi:aconitase B
MALQLGLLTTEKKGKKNIFSGHLLDTVNATAANTYHYLNFNELLEFVKCANSVKICAERKEAAFKLSAE